jgi:hypothetical protein
MNVNTSNSSLYGPGETVVIPNEQQPDPQPDTDDEDEETTTPPRPINESV